MKRGDLARMTARGSEDNTTQPPTRPRLTCGPENGAQFLTSKRRNPCQEGDPFLTLEDPPILSLRWRCLRQTRSLRTEEIFPAPGFRSVTRVPTPLKQIMIFSMRRWVKSIQHSLLVLVNKSYFYFYYTIKEGIKRELKMFSCINHAIVIHFGYQIYLKVFIWSIYEKQKDL